MNLYQYSSNRDNKIFSYLSARNLGEFTIQLLISAAIKETLRNHELAIFYIQDRLYKEQILSLYPGIDFTITGTPGERLPVNIFDVHAGRMMLNKPRMEVFGLDRS